MKALVLSAVIFLSVFVSLSSQAVWPTLGSTDAARLATTTRVVDRLFGVAGGDYCIGHYFYDQSDIYHKQMVAFLCTWFGGNPSKLAPGDSLPECQYRMEGDSGYPIIYSEQTADLLNALLFTHSDLYISVEEHSHFKSIMLSVLQSLKIDTSEISGMLDLTDNSIIYEDAFTRACPQVANITWISLVMSSSSTVKGNTICWVWNDNNTHAVLPTSDMITGFTGYGSGNASLNTSALCSDMPASNEPCYLDSPLRYCHRFDQEGNFRFIDPNNQATAFSNLGVVPPHPQTSSSSSSSEGGSGNQTSSISSSEQDSNLPTPPPNNEDLIIDYSPDSDAASTLNSFLFLF